MARTTTFVAVACSVLLAQRALALGATEGLLRRQLAGSDDDAPEWDYRLTGTHAEEPYGPSDWYLGYEYCGSNSQSPINLNGAMETVVKASEFDLEFYPKECSSADELIYKTNEHAWEVNFSDCGETSYLMFDGDKYNLLQLHIHSPSEHMIAGAEHDAEVHFVHVREGTDGDLLVVGVFYDVSDYSKNFEIQKLWDVIGIEVSTTDDEFMFSAYNMMPPNRVYAHYSGSLTTPPCTEGVKWLVMTEPTHISRAQLDEFRTSVALFADSKVSEFSNTNRPVQPLNDREVYLVTAS